MRRAAFPEEILAFVLLLTACSPSKTTVATRSPANIIEPTREATASLPTALPVVESPVATKAASIPVTGAVTVQVSNVGDFGPALVDGQGRTLYMFIGGEQYHRPSPCVGEECLEEWYPLFANGKPVAGTGVDATLLGMVPGEDGSTQVTYNGWRLYYFNQDKVPGDAMGQGDDKEWYLVSPSGEAIKSLERE